MVSSFLGYNNWFFTCGPGTSGHFISPIRINGSSIESLFGRLKFGAGGHLTALNYRSGLARIQARAEVKRYTDSGKGYRDDDSFDAPSNGSPTVMKKLSIEGRSKVFNLMVTEYLFPGSISQSSLGGRQGSNACTLIATLVGNTFVKQNLPMIDTYFLPQVWIDAVTNCIQDGNTLYDLMFEGQAVVLDVQDAFECFADELQLSSFDDNVCNCTNDDLSPVIGVISGLANTGSRKAGVLISQGMTVAILVTGESKVIIVDSHRHGSNGAIVAVGTTAENAVKWYAQTFRKYHNTPLGNFCTVTWLEFL